MATATTTTVVAGTTPSSSFSTLKSHLLDTGLQPSSLRHHCRSCAIRGCFFFFFCRGYLVTWSSDGSVSCVCIIGRKTVIHYHADPAWVGRGECGLRLEPLVHSSQHVGRGWHSLSFPHPRKPSRRRQGAPYPTDYNRLKTSNHQLKLPFEDEGLPAS